jgi:uncharacterized protein
MDADVSARPATRMAALASWAMSRRWSLPPARNRVTVARDVPVPVADGTVLRADHYIPVTGRPAATILIRTPYGRYGPNGLTGQILAERGYHVLIQSVRGTFGSGGVFDPMRDEAPDGQDTVAWLREQAWFSGRLATFGNSYLGFVQWALALDPPPELVAGSRAGWSIPSFPIRSGPRWIAGRPWTASPCPPCSLAAGRTV